MESDVNDFFEVHIGWIRQSNLIENVDDVVADQDSFDAWKMFTEQKKLTKDNILRCHANIMWRNHHKIAGELRKCNVRIADRICPDFKRVPNLIRKWLTVYSKAEKFEEIREAHIAFERIHPFVDGNGRTGRMVMNWMLLKRGLEIYPFSVADRQEYYRWFNENLKSWKGSIGDSRYIPSYIEMLMKGRGVVR